MRAGLGLLLASCSWPALFAQQVQTYTWPQIRDKFAAVNPTLRAGQLNIDESRAQEITAYLRPNPDFGLALDGTGSFVLEVQTGTPYFDSFTFDATTTGKLDPGVTSTTAANPIAIVAAPPAQ